MNQFQHRSRSTCVARFKQNGHVFVLLIDRHGGAKPLNTPFFVLAVAVLVVLQ
jgi:hypothetical protein